VLSPALKKFHDAVYCLTVESATDRQAEVVRQLGEGNFEFVYSIHKTSAEYEELINSPAVDPSAMRRDGDRLPLTPGEVCCSWGHLKIYEEFLKTGGERALIFEDDIVDLEVPEREIRAALRAVPRDAEIVYWGWAYGRVRPWNRVFQQGLDHVRYSLGLIEADHDQIRDRYIRVKNRHFLIAAENYLFHAYTVTREGARKMLELNTPIYMPADHLPVKLIAQGKMRGYLARKQLYNQRSFDPHDPMESGTRPPPRGIDVLPDDLKNFHDRVFVLTVPSSADRREAVVRELGEGNFEFFEGVDKADVSIDELRNSGVYDEEAAMRADRSSRAMRLGEVCCALGHRRIYEEIIASGAERCLIMEDDIVIKREFLTRVDDVVAFVPEGAELVYWGWLTGGRSPWYGGIKQAVYHFLHSLGSLKYDHTMIRNLYSRRHNEYFDHAGKHFGAHAYTVTRSAAKVLVEMNTPIVYNADNLLMQAVMQEKVRAFICSKPLLTQRSVDPNDPVKSLTQS
jgi:glycosyl transferase, family 25